MADRLAVGAHHGAFGAEMAVGVDLHLDAAIGEDRLGHDGHHVGALDLLADDEGRGLVVGIGGARADAGDEASPARRDRRPSRARRRGRPPARLDRARLRMVTGSQRTMRPRSLA
jgi:hypothetical protein